MTTGIHHPGIDRVTTITFQTREKSRIVPKYPNRLRGGTRPVGYPTS